MNIKRVFLVMAAVLLMPGLAMAGTSAGPGSFDFEVNIVFDPPNAVDEVTVDIVCESVVAPNDDSEDLVGDGGQAQFAFDTLTLEDATCVVTADEVSGWSSSYAASGPSLKGTPNPNSTSCTFLAAMFDPSTSVCDVTYTANVITYSITKDWDISGTGGNMPDPEYSLEIACAPQGSISGPDNWTAGAVFGVSAAAFCGGLDDCDFLIWDFVGFDDQFVWADVAVGADTECRAFESGVDASNIEKSASSACGVTDIDADESCVFTNTTFFEGIPTLNQYGLAILALLMLGVGFVGFRRFV